MANTLERETETTGSQDRATTAPEVEARAPEASPGEGGAGATTEVRVRRRRFPKWLGALVLLAIVVLAVAWFAFGSRPVPVTAITPTRASVRETIASSGRVGGTTETVVGAQASGVVSQLFVDEGDRVAAGQRLGVIQNDVARAQVAQARQAVETARAQLAEVASPPRRSEVAAAAGQAEQAEAQLAQQRAAIGQAEEAVGQARAQLRQAEAERDLAARQAERYEQLVETGVVSTAQYDEARTQLRVANATVASQRRAVEAAESNLRAARAGAEAARANVGVQRSRLETTRSGATSEEVAVARRRVEEAERALRVAEETARNAVVAAPFSGVVTSINAQVGQNVGASGILNLVSDDFEIRLDVDESNLADLSVGQRAVISSSTFTGDSFEGTVSEIGAAVDVARGTVEVTVRPVDPPEWLRPGQTVNVNIVTAAGVERLLVPAAALTTSGDRTVVYVVENGRAVEKPVVTRPPTEAGVPVIAGLEADDLIVADASKVSPGQEVRVEGAEGR